MELYQLLAQARQQWESGHSIMVGGTPRQVCDFLKLICTVRYPTITTEDLHEIEQEQSN